MQSRTLLLRLFAFVLAIFVLSILSPSQPAKAQFNPLDATFPPFGGRIVLRMPVTTQPPPNTAVICPSHTVVVTTSGDKFGLLGGKLYAYGNAITPGVKVLGRRTNIIVPTCVGAIGVFWPVYVLWFMGTSAY